MHLDTLCTSILFSNLKQVVFFIVNSAKSKISFKNPKPKSDVFPVFFADI